MRVDYPRKDGKARIRGTYNNIPFSINCNSSEVTAYTSRIQYEISQGTFNPQTYKNTHRDRSLDKSLKELYTIWVTKYKNGNLETNSNFSQVQSLIGDELPDISQYTWSYTTYNRRLTTLSQFAMWLVKEGHIAKNPYEGISKRSNPGKLKSYKREPLTTEEINKILSRVKADQHGQYYYTFLYTIFRTGLRNEEIIGLRVKYVDLNSNLIHVREVMARGKTSNSNKRIRKNTKNNKSRDIPIPQDLYDILRTHCMNKVGDDLVFTSPQGGCIDDRMLQVRIMRRIFKECGIPYRDLYACRHSLATRALDNNMPVTEVSLILGNTVDTMVRHYVKPRLAPKELPSM